MSNTRTFLWLFVYVQLIFISLDLYEHWRSAPRVGMRDTLRRDFPLILAVGMACLAYFLIQLLLAAAFPSIAWLMALVHRFRDANSPGLDRLWMLPVFAVAFFTGALFDYLVHRFLLHGPLFSLHENHHLPSVVSNVMPGIAARPFVVIPNFLINMSSCATIFGLVRLTGRPELIASFTGVLPALLLTFAFVASASHSIFLRRFDWVERAFRSLLLVTPREHLVHHAATLDGNYGNFTVLWDRIFRTYIPPDAAGEFSLGLDYDQDFLGAITAGRFKLSHQVRSRYQLGRVCRHHTEKDVTH